MTSPVNAMTIPEERQIVWEVLAQFWVDTEWPDSDLEKFAFKLASTSFTLDELDRIAFREVCGGFATFSTAVFATAGMALPDWYYPEEEARERVRAFITHRLRSVINPFWLPGFLLARWFLGNNWPGLRARVERARRETAV